MGRGDGRHGLALARPGYRRVIDPSVMVFPPGTFSTPPELKPPPARAKPHAAAPPAPKPASRKSRRKRRGEIAEPPEGAPDPDDKLPPAFVADPDHETRPRPRDPGRCPVHPLGFRGQVYYLFDCAGQLVNLGAQAIGQSSPILSLFHGDPAEWLRNRFPHFDRFGAWTSGFNISAASKWLMHECHKMGLYDPDSLPTRGHGVWSAQGMVAVHLGGKVIFMGETREERPAGFRDRGALWPALAEVAPPAPPLAVELAQQVERMFAKWHWWHPGEERVFTGLWAAGLLGAVIGWRPHGLLVGPPGSGKSTLLELYAALSPLAMQVNDYTAAGVRQLLTGRAAPLILDEADEDPETMGRLQQVISLLRRASGGEGARVVRGTGDGKAMQSTFMSPAMLGSVLAPPLMPQDATRITRMELIRIPEGAPTLPVERMMTWARKHAPALWGRAIEGIPRFRENLATMKTALIGRGCSPRLGDQLGTILAARALMMEDEPLSDMAAVDDALSVSWLLQTAAEAAEDGGPARCLAHLLNSEANIQESGERPTFAELVTRALQSQDDDARRKLAKHGLKLRGWPSIDARPESLFIARTHPALARVYHGTLWAGGRWADDMKHLSGACVPSDPISYGKGMKHRAVAIPAEHFTLPGQDDPAGPAPAPIDPEDIPFA